MVCICANMCIPVNRCVNVYVSVRLSVSFCSLFVTFSDCLSQRMSLSFSRISFLSLFVCICQYMYLHVYVKMYAHVRMYVCMSMSMYVSISMDTAQRPKRREETRAVIREEMKRDRDEER